MFHKKPGQAHMPTIPQMNKQLLKQVVSSSHAVFA